MEAEEKEQDTVQNPKQEIISASDIERYCYCPLSWWLGRHGFDAVGEEVGLGQKKHDKIGAELGKIQDKEKEAKTFERLLLWFAAMASILALIGITFVTTVESQLFKTVVDIVAIGWLLAALFYLYMGEKITLVGLKLKMEALVVVSGMVITIIAVLSIPLVIIVDKKIGLIFEILALVWLIGATVVLYFALKRHNAVDAKKTQQGIKGEVKYVDDAEAKQRSEVLMSDLHNLSGRPDYILKINNRFIPVEIKTGRVPKGPLFSHIIQLACYMLIIENNFGTPPYGILRYGDREHKIDYNEDLRRTLLEKISEMRNILRTNEAHRNHRRPGKCRSCSRRDKCPERLV